MEKMKNMSYIKKIERFEIFYRTLVVLFLFSFNSAIAQESSDSLPEASEKIKPALKLSSIKNSDESRSLIAVFNYKNKETKESFDIKGAKINFYVGLDSIVKLGTVETNENGIAKCDIKSDFIFPKNEEGFIHFSVDFEGNDAIRGASNEVDVKDLIIELSLEEIDSVKKVTVKVVQLNGKNEKIPLNEVEMPVCVARMFSHLKLGTITLTEGEGTFEFPSGLPGDTAGNVVVIAKFDENEEFGTVIKSQTIGWGIATKHLNAYSPRSLWTQVAPVWMIITLSIMLLGVWGHYVFVIIQLIILKRGQKNKA
jgi:hypothetical protein